ncbi:hypothetical protein FRC04_008470 [Tulasnella sp. 424]|nr:hypothetical protein FRC04_008470 [Tulasnella sp. 424]
MLALHLFVFALSLVLTTVDALPLGSAYPETTLQARVYTKRPKKTMTKKQGIIFGAVFGGWIVFVLLCSVHQKIKNRRLARSQKQANQEELKKNVEFDTHGKPFFKRKVPIPKRSPSMPELGSGAKAPLHDSGVAVPTLAPATTVKKPELVMMRREKDAWKEGTVVAAAPDGEVSGVADLTLEKENGRRDDEKAPFKLF